MSHIFCIIDGMTDPSFRAADYPHLNSIRLTRYQKTVPDGCAAESLTCILTLLGVDHIPPHLRGYVEALGAGIVPNADDLVVRTSWFGVRDGLCTAPVDAPDFIMAPAQVDYHSLGGYKSLLVLKGMAGEIEQICTVPPYGVHNQPVEKMRPSGSALLARLFEDNRTETLCMIPWGQSRAAAVAPFAQRAAVVCGADIVRGIARLLGMDVVPVAGADGDVHTDLAAKTQAALRAAADYPFVLLHINGADEASHRRDAAEKRRFLTEVDRLVIRPLLDSPHRITVTADHSTDPQTGTHGGTEQPVFERE